MLGFLAALCVVASWFTGTRLAALQDQELNRYKTDADVRISSANESAAKANEQAQSSKAASDSAKLKQLEIEQQNKELQLRVEQEKRARLEIEKRLADRHISVEQAEKIRHSLSGFKGHKLTLTLMQSNPESIAFGNELKQTLSAAGFDLTVTTASLLIGGPTYPISIIYGKNRVAEANAIGLALLTSGVIDNPLPAVVATDGDGLNLAVRPK